MLAVGQSLSHAWLLCNPMNCNTPGFSVLHYLLEFAQTHVHWVSDAIQPSHPLSLPSLPAFNLSHHLFQWVSPLLQVAKVLELQHQSFQWIVRVVFLYQWLVWSLCCPRDSQESFLAPQFKSINSSALSLLYGPTLTSAHDHGKNHSFDIRTFVGKVKSLFFNMLFRFVIVFLPSCKCLSISWPQSPSAVILEPKKIKSVTVSIFFPTYLLSSDGTRCHVLLLLAIISTLSQSENIFNLVVITV